MLTVTVVQHDVGPNGDPINVVERYKQTLDAVDLPALVALVNRKPRAPRVRKAKDAA